MENAYIYGLCDPRTAELRYVGKTRDLKIRLNGHISQAKNRPSVRRDWWVRSLLNIDLRPELFVIETVPVCECAEAEIFWIAYFRSIGCNLTNLTTGGEGTYGRIATPEQRARLSAALKARYAIHGFSPETLAALAKAHEARRGTTVKPEVKAKISSTMTGMKRSSSEVAKSSKSRTNCPKPVRFVAVAPNGTQ